MNLEKKIEEKIAGLILSLNGSDLVWISRMLLKILRLTWRKRPIQAERGPDAEIHLPTGPFETTRTKQLGDLLLWVPRRIDSFLIDDLTGGYGYSHSTVDTGEIDVPTQKPIMVEITTGQTVMRKFQDQFAQRAYVRVPLSRIGVDVDQFVACVKSKLGEPYDTLYALTLGEIQNPAKEVCSRLVSDCLPETERKRIARAHELGLLRRDSVSLHSKIDAPETKEFISPNGFAEYYEAPPGRKLAGPDIIVQPRPVEISPHAAATAAARHKNWKLVMVAGVMGISVLLAYMLRRDTAQKENHAKIGNALT